MCSNVHQIHKTAMHVCRGNQNFSKRVSTNFAYYSFEIERNFKCSKNHNKEIKSNHDIVIQKHHLYSDMKLATFGINRNKNLIIQFLVFIQPYTQQPLVLYQIETVSISIIDQNTQADSYTNLQVDRLCIAVNPEIYIAIIQQELRTC